MKVSPYELAQIRRDAIERRRNDLIAERAAAWSREEPAYDWLRLLLVIAVIGLVALIGYGGLQRFAHGMADDMRTREIVQQCKGDGGVPNVDRDADGKALAVRCERSEP